ncbi:hypothetical protein BB561_006761, partial [Smittium simulii]
HNKNINPLEIHELKQLINKTATSVVAIDYKCTNIKNRYNEKIEKLNNRYVHPTIIKFLENRLQKRPGIEDLAKSIETEILKIEQGHTFDKMQELQLLKDTTFKRYNFN